VSWVLLCRVSANGSSSSACDSQDNNKLDAGYPNFSSGKTKVDRGREGVINRVYMRVLVDRDGGSYVGWYRCETNLFSNW